MKIESNLKQDQIVEAALKRFSHFGIAKTTVTEVADDLAVSKQVLAYYFHDKQSLVNAVVEKLAIEYSNHLKAKVEQSNSVEEALLKLTEVKAIFFEKYFMLLPQYEQSEPMKSQSYNNWKQFLTEKESGLLTKLFETGMKTGELKPLNACKTAELLIETLHALAKCVKDKGALPGAEAFHEIQLKQQEIIKIFYQGLKEHGRIEIG